VHQRLAERKADSLALLNEAVKSLEEDLADIGESSTWRPPVMRIAVNDEIFIVHGCDDSAKVEVARLIEHAGLKAAADRNSLGDLYEKPRPVPGTGRTKSR
jgi:hypothetical protein